MAKKTQNIEWIDPENTQAVQDVEFSGILKYCLLQIVKAQTIGSTAAFKQLVANLDIMLINDRDNTYRDEVEIAKEKHKRRMAMVNPRDRWRYNGNWELAQAQDMFEILIKLMGRNAYLGEKTFKI